MTGPQKKVTWVAVPIDVTVDRRVTWHATHEPIRLDGMSGVVFPELILTLCRASLERHQISRTAQLLPEISNDRLCGCCVHPDLRVPNGWMLEPLPRMPDYLLLSTPLPVRYMATIDFRARGVRSGYCVTGKFVGEEWNKRRKKYNGRGWKQALVDDALSHLQEVL